MKLINMLWSCAPLVAALAVMPAFVQGSSRVTCTEGIVECVGGFVSNGNGSPFSRSCFAECDGKCCSTTGEAGGSDACVGFTGSVCKDGSCVGSLACESAGIGLIEGASCVGDYACADGGRRGRINSIKNASCVGHSACDTAGSQGGFVGSIEDKSCVGPDACQMAGSYEGYVKSIKDASCLGLSACKQLGAYGGNIDSVIDCCNKGVAVCSGHTMRAGLPDNCAAPPVPVMTNPSHKPTPMVSVTPVPVTRNPSHKPTPMVSVNPSVEPAPPVPVMTNPSHKPTPMVSVKPVPVTRNPSHKPTPMVSVNPSVRPTLVSSVAAQNPSSSPTPSPTDKTNVDHYIDAYKCNPDENYVPDNSPLTPNARLHLCIRPVLSDVLIDNLESMIATEQTSANNIVVIEKYVVDMLYRGPSPGVVVTTRFPINTFAWDKPIDITGTIVMKLTGRPGARRLRAPNSDSVGTGVYTASFDIKVDLHNNNVF